MRLLKTFLFLFLSSCTAPSYQQTTYGIDEFVKDSFQISQGKMAILALEDHEEICHPSFSQCYEDVILDGDELSVTLFCPRRPDYIDAMEWIHAHAGFRVLDGKICLPHLAPLDMAGLTLNEAKEIIQNAYREQISDVQIFLNFKKKCERYVQIIGAGEGRVSIDKGTRLSEVLSKARFSPTANLFKSYVIRKGEKLPIDLYQLIHEGNNCQNIVMQGGDQIFFAHSTDAPLLVTGELRSRVIPIPYGMMTLREALALSGGIPFTGNKNCIQVIRGDLIRPKIYLLDWNEIVHYPNRSLLLMPGDIVVLSEKPITQWNRFINQLQPSTDCMQTSLNIYDLCK